MKKLTPNAEKVGDIRVLITVLESFFFLQKHNWVSYTVSNPWGFLKKTSSVWVDRTRQETGIQWVKSHFRPFWKL